LVVSILRATGNGEQRPGWRRCLRAAVVHDRQAGNTITPNSTARWDNALTYTTPNWGGFTGKAIYSFGENSTGMPGSGMAAPGPYNDNNVSTDRQQQVGVGANFATGAFNVDAVYQVASAGHLSPPVPAYVSNSPATGDDINEWYVGGSFDLKFVKLMASYQDQDDKNTLNNDNSTWTLGAVVPLGNFGIHLQYAQTDFDRGSVRSTVRATAQ
jgi:predicted porin